jgi:hypothetical protein
VLHGVGAGTLVQHGVDPAEFAAGEALVEVAAVEVVRQLRAEQVAVLGPVGQVVDGDHVVDAHRVEPVNDVAADHAGRAGDDHLHANNSS